MSLRDQLLQISNQQPVGIKHKPIANDAKAVILCDLNDSQSLYLARKLMSSITRTRSGIDYSIYPAATTTTVAKILASKIPYLGDASTLPWTWPISESENGPCLKTGIYKEADPNLDQAKVIANTVSHMKAWQHCIDLDQPIIIMNSNVRFVREFNKDIIRDDWLVKEESLKNVEGIDYTPAFNESLIGLGPIEIDDFIDSKYHYRWLSNRAKRGLNQLPHGTHAKTDMYGVKKLTGFSSHRAYWISPWAARKALDHVKNVGLWPVWAILSRELCPWALVAEPPYIISLVDAPPLYKKQDKK